MSDRKRLYVTVILILSAGVFAAPVLHPKEVWYGTTICCVVLAFWSAYDLWRELKW